MSKSWAHVDGNPQSATSANPVRVIEPLIILDDNIVPGVDAFAPNLFFVEAVGAPSEVTSGWTYNGTGFAAPIVAPLSVAELGRRVAVMASNACDVITRQVIPDMSHQTAYLNAAALVGPGATVPTLDPAKTVFANMASANGMEPQAFATLVAGVQLASLQLATALAVVRTGVAAAASTSDLQAVLATFEKTISDVVSEVGTAGISLNAPASIVLDGLNT